jgi:hypothetical protein
MKIDKGCGYFLDPEKVNNPKEREIDYEFIENYFCSVSFWFWSFDVNLFNRKESWILKISIWDQIMKMMKKVIKINKMVIKE